MSGNPGAGFEYPPQKVSWNKREVLLFANSIGATVDELHLLYELHPNFAVFPTYAIILPFKGTTFEVVDFYAAQNSARQTIPGIPKLDSKRVVDGERHIQFFKPIPTTSEGRNFECRAKVVGVYDKGKATVLETQTDLVDADTGELYTRAIGSGFFVGQGGWGGPAGPKAQSFTPPKGKKPDAVYEHPISAEAAHLYRLNGDYNPLHATPEPGKAMGFGGAIMHGLYSWNTTAHALVKVLGGSDPANIKDYQARFASPVKPGDTLITEIWRTGEKDSDGFEEIRFVTSIKGGKVCLSNGRAKIRVTGKKENRKQNKYISLTEKQAHIADMTQSMRDAVKGLGGGLQSASQAAGELMSTETKSPGQKKSEAASASLGDMAKPKRGGPTTPDTPISGAKQVENMQTGSADHLDMNYRKSGE